MVECRPGLVLVWSAAQSTRFVHRQSVAVIIIHARRRGESVHMLALRATTTVSGAMRSSMARRPAVLLQFGRQHQHHQLAGTALVFAGTGPSRAFSTAGLPSVYRQMLGAKGPGGPPPAAKLVSSSLGRGAAELRYDCALHAAVSQGVSLLARSVVPSGS